MNWWLLPLPFVAAALGWWLVRIAFYFLFHPVYPRKFLGVSIQGIIPKRQTAIALEAGQLSASFLSVNEIEEKITHPDNVKKIMPQAEEHIDHFLRVKLVKSMPVVGMFVGDKTISNLKALFVAELEQLFPEIMKTYMGRLQEDFDIAKIVAEKLASYPVTEIEKAVRSGSKKELRAICWAAASFGFIISLLHLLLFYFTRH